jgi:hypothetical protein
VKHGHNGQSARVHNYNQKRVHNYNQKRVHNYNQKRVHNYKPKTCARLVHQTTCSATGEQELPRPEVGNAAAGRDHHALGEFVPGKISAASGNLRRKKCFNARFDGTLRAR